MKIVVAPLHALEATVRTTAASHIVSLASPGAEPVAIAHHGPLLRLAFNDIDAPRDGLVAPDDAHVMALLDFAAGWDGERPLLVHCWAGVSRSPAAAYIIGCARLPRGEEAGLALALRTTAPFATPNPRMVALADARLGRDGAMIDAIRAIGRGAEVGLGVPFTLGVSAEPPGAPACLPPRDRRECSGVPPSRGRDDEVTT